MSRTGLYVLACCFVALAAVDVAMVSTQLAGGAVEVGRHWWSTLAAAGPLLIAAGLVVAARLRPGS